MAFFPVAISLLVSFESSIMMLGLPAEGYIYGIQYFWSAFGFFTATFISMFVMVPLIHPLRITSAYEYLELRFQSRVVRLWGTVLGMLNYIWYMGIVLFGPAVALEAVTDFPMLASILVISLVSVIYTSIGGLKAVIWTDVFQAVVMTMGILAILIKGTMEAGGPSEVWRKADEGGRLNFFIFDTDIRIRHTFWGLYVATSIRVFGLVFNQSTIQRISSTKTLAEAKRVLGIVAPFFTITLSLAVYEGIVAYAYYETKGCDPFESKDLTNPNQIVPYTVMDIFTGLPGMPGLFLAALFSASLSTLSSGLSSNSALLWTDIIKPLAGDISELKATMIAKISVVIFGVLACGVAVIVSLIDGPLTQIAGSLLSGFQAPLTGIFFIGCFCPRVKASSAMVGGIVGSALTTWVAMGMNFNKNVVKTPWLPPASITNCPVDSSNSSDVFVNVTTSQVMTLIASTTTTTTTEPTSSGPEGIEQIYGISYLWLSPIGIFGTMIVAMIASVFLGQNKPGDVDPRYLIPVSKFLFFLPASVREKISSIGPQFIKDEYKERFEDPAKKHWLKGTEMETVVSQHTDEKLLDNRANVDSL